MKGNSLKIRPFFFAMVSLLVADEILYYLSFGSS